MPPARDVALLDVLNGFAREPLAASLWRVVLEGRDPLECSTLQNRWCDGAFAVLYGAFERDGAIAEIHSRLVELPAFPTSLRWFVHRISARATNALRLPDLATLERLGVDVGRYRERDYGRTQAIAEAAHFLGFDAVIAPSARWGCAIAALFAERIAEADLRLEATEAAPVDWQAWRSRRKSGH